MAKKRKYLSESTELFDNPPTTDAEVETKYIPFAKALAENLAYKTKLYGYDKLVKPDISEEALRKEAFEAMKYRHTDKGRKEILEAVEKQKQKKNEEFGTIDYPKDNELQYAFRRFANSRVGNTLYYTPFIGELMFGTQIADKIKSKDFKSAGIDLAAAIAIGETLGLARKGASKAKRYIDKKIIAPIVNNSKKTKFGLNNSKIVNDDGTINNRNLLKGYRTLRLYGDRLYGTPKMSLRTPYNSSRKTTTLRNHIEDVVKSAQSFPVPKGVSKADYIRATLFHDIGKLYTGQEGSISKHGAVSKKLIKVLSNEFDDRKSVASVISHHMYNNGKGASFRHGIVDNLNYDFLRALQAADVSRGLEYDAAAAKFSHLFTYDKANPVTVNFYKGSYEDQIKNVLKPLLIKQGYDAQGITSSTIDKKLQDFASTHRRFFRGYTNGEQGATTISSSKATGGRNGFKDIQKSYLKIPSIGYDAKYVTPSVEYAKVYKLKRSGKLGLVELANTPEFKKSMSDVNSDIAEFYDKANYQLMDINNIMDDISPMSYFQKYEEPYRLQTGRSLMTDLKQHYRDTYGKEVMFDKQKFFTKIKEPGSMKEFEDVIKQMKDIGGIDFKPYGDKKYGYRRINNFEYLFQFLNAFDAARFKPDDDVFRLAVVASDLYTNGIITRESIHSFNNAFHKALFSNDRHGIKKAFDTHIWNKNTMHNLYKDYNHKLYDVTSKAKYTDEYKAFLQNEQNTVNFMRSKGVVPLWDMPHYGKDIVFGYQDWGYKPIKRNGNFVEETPLGYVVGKDGEKPLNLVIDDITNIEPYINGSKETGRSKVGVSRKTYNLGGQIKHLLKTIN